MNGLTFALAGAFASAAIVLVATYLYGRRLYTTQRRRARESGVLLDIAGVLNSTLDLTEMLKRVTQRAAQVCGGSRCTIMLLAEDGKVLIPRMSQFSDGHKDDEMWGVFKDVSQPWRVKNVPEEIRHVIREQKPLFVPDASVSSLPAQWVEPFDIKSVLLVPLISKEEVVGLMAFDHMMSDRGFTDEQEDLAVAIAAQAAVAIENARLYEETQHRAKQASLLNDVAQQINVILSPDHLLPAVAETIHQHFGYDSVSLMLVDHEQKNLRVAGVAGVDTGIIPEDFRQPLDQGIIGWVARHGELLLSNDTGQEKRYFAPFPERYQAGSELAVPLKVGERTVGVLDLQCRETNGFDKLSVATAQTLAEQVATALQNAQLYEESHQRAIQMKAAAEVARGATAILDVDQLLDETVHLISDRFGFYHAGVFLLDEQGKNAVLQAASSEGGRRMLEQGHKLAVGEVGIVGHVAGTGEPRIALDVGKDAVFFDNPHLPDTRSEIALPLTSRGKIIGVLDVQSVREAAFGEENVTTLQTLADQLANAIENARLFEAELERRREAETLYRAAQALTTTLDLPEVFEHILSELQQVVPYDSASVQLLQNGHLEIIGGRGFPNLDELKGLTFDPSSGDNPNQQVMRQREPFIVDDAPALYPDFHKEPHAAANTRAWLGVPLLIGDEFIGMLALDKQEPQFYTSKHADLASAFAAQAAIAIENARLFEAAQRRAVQLSTLNRIGRHVAAILDQDELLQRAVDAVREDLGYLYAAVLLVDEGASTLYVAAATDNFWEIIPDGHRQPLGKGVIGIAAETGETVLIDDASTDPRPFQAGEWLSPSSLSAPIKVGEQVIGVLEVEDNTPNAFDENDRLELESLADQIAIAIENARLYERTQRHVEELAALHHIDIAIASTLDLDEVLQRVYEQVSNVMDVTTFHIALYDEEKDELHLPLIVDQGKQLSPLTLKAEAEDSLSNWVLRNQEPLWIEDTEESAPPVGGIAVGPPTRSLMVSPLISRDRIVGAISAQSYEPHAFDEDHYRLFSDIARQVAIAVENARLFEETNRRLNEISLLHDVALASAASLDFDDILRDTVEFVRERLQLDVFGFLLVDEEADVVRLHPTSLGVPDDTAGFSTPLGEGITGWVAQKGEPLLIPDVSQDPRYLDAIPDIRSEICVPLRIGDKVIGVIDAESTQLNAFSEDDVRIFSTLAAQLGIALEKARLFEETNRRLAETQLLQEVMLAAASTLDFDEMLERTIEALHRKLGIEHLSFFIPSEHGEGLRMHPSQIGYSSEMTETLMPLDGSVGGRVYQTGEPQIISDVREVPYYYEGTPETRSELSVPVKVGGRVVAVINTESPQVDAFGEDDLHLLQAVAAQLGVVLDNVRLHEETKRRLAEAQMIQEVTLAAASTLDFDLVLERAVKVLHKVLHVGRPGFLLPDKQQKNLVSYPSLVDQATNQFRIPIEGNPIGRAYQTGRPRLVRDIPQTPTYLEGDADIHSMLAVPVRLGNRVVAVLYAESPRARDFGEDELRLFTTIAGQLGVTLENARLYRTLQEQADELSQAYEELKELDHLRSELVQNVSHELHTPLSLIQGYVELLAAEDLGPVHDKQQEALQIIRERTSTLARLIHNLTTLQSVPQERPILIPTSVVDVVQRTLAEFRRPAKRARIFFDEKLPAELPPVLGDRAQLELVLGHLIDNAIKFSPDSGIVTINAWANDDWVCVSIADEGIGIAPKHVDRIFERFYQVDGSASRRFGGMGVGLALVWEIVEAHGGTVEVESQPGIGSKFTVVLPRAEERA